MPSSPPIIYEPGQTVWPWLQQFLRTGSWENQDPWICGPSCKHYKDEVGCMCRCGKISKAKFKKKKKRKKQQDAGQHFTVGSFDTNKNENNIERTCRDPLWVGRLLQMIYFFPASYTHKLLKGPFLWGKVRGELEGRCWPWSLITFSSVWTFYTCLCVIFYFCTIYRVHLGLGSGIVGHTSFLSLYFFMWGGKTLINVILSKAVQRPGNERGHFSLCKWQGIYQTQILIPTWQEGGED